MEDGHLRSKIVCSICKEPVSLMAADTCSDEHGRPVHEACYMSDWQPRTPLTAIEGLVSSDDPQWGRTLPSTSSMLQSTMLQSRSAILKNFAALLSN